MKVVNKSNNDVLENDESQIGLQLINLPYVEQLIQKKQMVENLIRNITKIDTKVNDVIGMDDPYHYRNKIHVVIGNQAGKIISGMYQENSHTIIPFESSVIHDVKADEIINSITRILTKIKIPAYNEDTKIGLVRHILVKRGLKTNQTMVVIVTSSDIFPGRNNFVKALREVHPEITTIVQNVNSRSTSIVLGNNERVLYGKGYITDILCGLKFNISVKSFYQVNPIQTEVLYNKAIEYAEFTGNEVILDAYCGIGTIGLITSKHVKEVIGVEINRDAIKDAINNAKNNNITNARFFCADASTFMKELVENKQKVDLVFLDPPRTGCDKKFLESLVKFKPKKIIYISCDPSTLARDLYYLVNNQYKVIKIQPIDMFPHTKHVECVVLMSRVK
jgi:23S rRNA (uracil1939-C5)-methyltransferase